jgi:hypothetical protein
MTPASDPQSYVGATLADKYLLKRVLGRGGMGAVYEGVHVEIGKRVAIKVISVHLGQHGENAARFRREARAASAVESEHIAQVFDVGHDARVGLYMVMELLSGEDLSTRIAREKRIDVTAALPLFHQALRGLGKAHAAGVVHRDLKPANIFLVNRDDGSPLVKVLDFGISKFVRDSETAFARTEGEKLTRAGSVLGTVLYMSPEQAKGLEDIDHRTDIWSLGAVFYEMLAGRTPIDPAPTYEGMLYRVATTPPTPLLQVASHVPAAIAEVLHKALSPDASARIGDCATFAQLLNRATLAAGLEPRGRPSGPVAAGALAAGTFAGAARTSPVPGAPLLPPKGYQTTGAGVVTGAAAGGAPAGARRRGAAIGRSPRGLLAAGAGAVTLLIAATLLVHWRGHSVVMNATLGPLNAPPDAASPSVDVTKVNASSALTEPALAASQDSKREPPSDALAPTGAASTPTPAEAPQSTTTKPLSATPFLPRRLSTVAVDAGVPGPTAAPSASAPAAPPPPSSPRAFGAVPLSESL